MRSYSEELGASTNKTILLVVSYEAVVRIVKCQSGTMGRQDRSWQ